MIKPRKPYNEEIFLEILTIISKGRDGITKVLSTSDKFPSPFTFYRWLEDEDNEMDGYPISKWYARAKEIQAENLRDEMYRAAYDNSNDTSIEQYGEKTVTKENREWTSRSKLIVDTIKWDLAKLHPKKYNDSLTLKGDDENPISIQKISFKE